MTEPRKITGFSAGDPLRIQRRVVHPCPGVPVTDVTLTVKRGSETLLAKTSQPSFPPISQSGSGLNPDVGTFLFDLPPEETGQFRKYEHLSYEIGLQSDSGYHPVEAGFLIAGDPAIPPNTVLPGHPGYALTTSYTTYADACQTVTGRTAMIIDGFLDAILGNYRQLKVWDEHARRRADNPNRLQLSYEYINKFTPIEIYDGNNNPIPPNQIFDFDYRNGNFEITSDDGNQDYFVTYTFNFFPEAVLLMFVQQSLLELNFVGAGAGGGYVTSYQTVDSSPAIWDGITASGAAAKAWKRLATDLSIWRNWLIFDGDVGPGIQAPTGATAQQMAESASTYYQTIFDTTGAATKFQKFIAFPTQYYTIFATSGFGQFGPFVVGNQVNGGPFRGLVINKGWSY